jgi:hypothetical protein
VWVGPHFSIVHDLGSRWRSRGVWASRSVISERPQPPHNVEAIASPRACGVSSFLALCTTNHHNRFHSLVSLCFENDGIDLVVNAVTHKFRKCSGSVGRGDVCGVRGAFRE